MGMQESFHIIDLTKKNPIPNRRIWIWLKNIQAAAVSPNGCYAILLSPDIKPLSPANLIIVSAGPLTGTGVPGALKIVTRAKSTSSAAKDKRKYYVPRSSGGTRYFGNMMKRASYDHIVITGKSAKQHQPVS